MSQPSEADSGSTPPEVDAGEGAERIPTLPRERYDLRILASLRQIIHHVGVYSRKLTVGHGITVPQLVCLLKLDEIGSMTVKDLAEEAYLSPSTVVGIVDRLERNGLVGRERSVRDRRRVRVSLTERGREMVADAPSPLQDSLAGAIEQLPELERATIALSFEKVTALMATRQPDLAADESVPVLATDAALEAGAGAHRENT